MNKNFRSSEAKVAEAIIDEEITALKERLRYLTMRPVMVQLHEKMNCYEFSAAEGFKTGICQTAKSY